MSVKRTKNPSDLIPRHGKLTLEERLALIHWPKLNPQKET